MTIIKKLRGEWVRSRMSEETSLATSFEAGFREACAQLQLLKDSGNGFVGPITLFPDLEAGKETLSRMEHDKGD